jgi:hypothetical protein
MVRATVFDAADRETIEENLLTGNPKVLQRSATFSNVFQLENVICRRMQCNFNAHCSATQENSILIAPIPSHHER